MSLEEGYYTLILHWHYPLPNIMYNLNEFYRFLADSLIPTLMFLDELIEEKRSFRIVSTITPFILEQLENQEVLEGFKECLFKVLKNLEEVKDWEYREARVFLTYRYERVLEKFFGEYKGRLKTWLTKLVEKEYMELLLTPFTHPLLPLISSRKLFEKQFEKAYKILGEIDNKIKGVWFPELAYSPSLLEMGLKDIFNKYRLEYLVTEYHLIEGGRHITTYPFKHHVSEKVYDKVGEKSTLTPYVLKGTSIKVFARNSQASLLVANLEEGYLLDKWYKSFQNLKNNSKEPYIPAKAYERVMDHARHYIKYLQGVYIEKPESLVIGAFRGDFFGYKWFEGPWWIKEVLKLAPHSVVKTVTLREYLETCPETPPINLGEGSWGPNGDLSLWTSREVKWTRRIIRKVEEKYENRELSEEQLHKILLLESSDWQPLILSNEKLKEKFQELVNEVSNN